MKTLKKSYIRFALLTACLIVMTITSGFFNSPDTAVSKFGTFKDVKMDCVPSVPDYQVLPDLSNVTNRSHYDLSPKQKELLSKNGFFVEESYAAEFFGHYEGNRYRIMPNFVTTDSIIHTFHLMFDHSLTKTEENYLSAELANLSQSMLSASVKQLSLLSGSDWENASTRNIGFFAVGSKLINSGSTVPEIVSEEVAKELTLIEKHDSMEISPVMNLKKKEAMSSGDPELQEDYTQYVPRGHYDKNDTLKKYFKTMMWYGRIPFRTDSDDGIKSAILITLALKNDVAMTKSWERIFEPVNFFVGKCDDLTFYEFSEVLLDVYGPNPELKTLVNDKEKFAQFKSEVSKLRSPQINSLIAEDSSSDRQTSKAKNFRFMGQRFTIDAFIFQNLVNDARRLPKGLDIPAVFGSDEALGILQDMGEDQYPEYMGKVEMLRSQMSDLKLEDWTQNLYWGWLFTIQPLLEKKSDGYPSFMKNDAWTRKELSTYMGSWTELKRDTILYTKQVYAECGGDGEEDEIEKWDDRGYVEPNPILYGRLEQLAKLTREGLTDLGMISEPSQANFEKLEKLSGWLRSISQKELENKPLSDEDYELIRSYGAQLEHFWLEVNKEDIEAQGTYEDVFLDQNPSPVIADVATNVMSGTILEEGTGFVSTIYVVVPVDGKLRIASGQVFSYYEFEWPMNNRLTDKKWHGILRSRECPSRPEWTNVYYASSEE